MSSFFINVSCGCLRRVFRLFACFCFLSTISGCAPSEEEEFYNRFLFLDAVAFTIHGTKPITEVTFDRRSAEEKVQLRQAYFESLSLKDQKRFLKYEKNPHFRYDYTKLWDRYKTDVLSSSQRFLFVKKREEIKEWEYLYVVNVLEATKVIYKNYALFRKFIGSEFDPLELVLSIQGSSPFWDQMFSRETTPEKVCLWGILFGYGFENSYPFSLHFAEKNSRNSGFIDSLISRFKLAPESLKVKKIHSQDFPLPGFIPFESPSSSMRKFEEESKQIKKLYKGKHPRDVLFSELRAGQL